MDKTKSMMRVALIAMLALTAQSAAAALEIHFETNAVRITGAARGGRIACMFVDRAPLNTFSGSTVVADTDNDGEIRLVLPQPLSDRVVWAAVDLDTGEFAAATTAGAITQLTFHGHSFRLNGGEIKQMESHDFQRLDFLLVRPRTGAWVLSGSDGGQGDSDGKENRTFVLDVGSLKPLLQAFGPPPKKFDKGDVVVIFDPSTSDVFVAEVGK